MAHAGVAGLIGLLVATWALFKIVFFIEGVLDQIWRSKTRRSPGCTLKKAFFGWLFLAAIVTVGAVSPQHGAQRIAIEFLCTWLFFIGFNKAGPNRRIRWRQALPGSLVGATAWYATKWGFTAYLTRLDQPDHVYAVIGVLPLFLVWLYCTFAILLASACLNFVLSRRPEPEQQP
jgi:YihY family inner membrane protein